MQEMSSRLQEAQAEKDSQQETILKLRSQLKQMMRSVTPALTDIVGEDVANSSPVRAAVAERVRVHHGKLTSQLAQTEQKLQTLESVETPSPHDTDAQDARIAALKADVADGEATIAALRHDFDGDAHENAEIIQEMSSRLQEADAERHNQQETILKLRGQLKQMMRGITPAPPDIVDEDSQRDVANSSPVRAAVAERVRVHHQKLEIQLAETQQKLQTLELVKNRDLLGELETCRKEAAANLEACRSEGDRKLCATETQHAARLAELETEMQHLREFQSSAHAELRGTNVANDRVRCFVTESSHILSLPSRVF